MKSKLRKSTVLIYILITLLFGCISIVLLRDSPTITDKSIIIAMVTFLFFLLLLGSIYKFGSVIELNLRDEILTVQRPFIFKKMIYKFSEVRGFGFENYFARGITYQTLKIRVMNKTFYISDFETKNFKELEAIFLNKFQLLDQNNKIIIDERRKIEIQKREMEKQNQTKEILILLRNAKFLCGFMILITIMDLIYRGINTPKIFWILFCFTCTCFVYYKSKNVN